MGGEFTIPIPYTWASCLDVILFPGVYKVTREIMWIPPARRYLPAAVPWSQHSKVTRPQDGSEILFAGSRDFSQKVDGKLYKKVGNFHQLVDNPLRFWEFSSSNNWESWTILNLQWYIVMMNHSIIGNFHQFVDYLFFWRFWESEFIIQHNWGGVSMILTIFNDFKGS